ncbi:MAG TPA: hypothetical protein VFB54_17275 [Burkholderiales bacterium]|nr:hypothetical protein [Burkholderiales bacterium]
MLADLVDQHDFGGKPRADQRIDAPHVRLDRRQDFFDFHWGAAL